MANKHRDQVTIPPEEWPGLLSDDLREHFERIGEELVARDIHAHNYAEPEKHFAAIHWLGEKRRERDDREGSTLSLVRWTLAIAVLTLVATIAVGFWG